MFFREVAGWLVSFCWCIKSGGEDRKLLVSFQGSNNQTDI